MGGKESNQTNKTNKGQLYGFDCNIFLPLLIIIHHLILFLFLSQSIKALSELRNKFNVAESILKALLAAKFLFLYASFICMLWCFPSNRPEFKNVFMLI